MVDTARWPTTSLSCGCVLTSFDTGRWEFTECEAHTGEWWWAPERDEAGVVTRLVWTKRTPTVGSTGDGDA